MVGKKRDLVSFIWIDEPTDDDLTGVHAVAEIGRLINGTAQIPSGQSIDGSLAQLVSPVSAACSESGFEIRFRLSGRMHGLPHLLRMLPQRGGAEGHPAADWLHTGVGPCGF